MALSETNQKLLDKVHKGEALKPEEIESIKTSGEEEEFVKLIETTKFLKSSGLIP